MSITTGEGEIVLFGVRLVVDSMRKSVSLNNLSQYVLPHDPLPADKDVGTGYGSADESAAVQNRSSLRDRKRGVPWTEEEHKLFLLGLQKVGKGDWRGISRNFVKSRTPTQVASHAQKYFLRRSNLSRRRRRSSLFDITTDTVDQHANKNVGSQSPRGKPAQGATSEMVIFSATPAHPILAYPVVSPVQVDQIMSEKVPVMQDYMSWNTTTDMNHHQMGPSAASAEKAAVRDLDLNDNSMTDSSLNLSLSLASDGSNLTRQSPFHAIPSFFSGDSMISVG